MSISKISRSLFVALFLILIIFMGYQDVRLLLSNTSSNVTLNILKVVYIIVAVILVLLYVYIKGKLYRKKVKRNISLVYRYVYITFIVIAMSIISIFKYLYLIDNVTLIIYVVLKLAISLILKKIIFNVSKSDILSVLGTFFFAMLPYAYYNSVNLFTNLINTLIVFSVMLLIQMLIDELKQQGIKNKKYIIYSLILGALVSCTIILGVSGYVWIGIALISLLITVNLDRTHIGFPRKILSFLNTKTKDTLYRVERVNISKLIVSILIIALVAVTVVLVSKFIAPLIKIQNDLVYNLVNFNTSIKSIDISTFVSDIFFNTDKFLQNSRTYYLVILVYIVFIEVLAIVLRRRYDTKSTVMKVLFILLYLSISLFKLDISNYQTILTVFLILIAIVNTSNIYLNREERIKMLVA